MLKMDKYITKYNKLICEYLSHQLPGEVVEEIDRINLKEACSLLGYASILSLSSESSKKMKAYDIATAIASLFPAEKGLVATASFILARLGNFPGQKLLLSRFGRYLNEGYSFHPLHHLEVAIRQIENTIEIRNGKEYILTDFQAELLELVEGHGSASISAPTSAGKTFTFSLEVVRRLSSYKGSCIVYLVPTRALIKQVSHQIRTDLVSLGMHEIPVRCVPFPIAKSECPGGVVYVLTQERLLCLLNQRSDDFNIDTIIVDEAQGIGDGARGVLLNTAIDSIVRIFSDVRLYFISPLINNPQFLLTLFGRSEDAYIKEDFSPVSQNILLVSEVPQKPTKILVTLLKENEEIRIGTCELKFRFRPPIYDQRAKLAISVTSNDDSTIIYCNKPKDTEEIASVLQSLIEADVHEDVYAFIEFLREHIHPQHPLIEALQSGVAYHYGFMPAIVRSRIEQLATDGKLKYICCTSTLLQGVNLPAKNIIIEKPKRGSRRVMTRGDFLNLAGRAGRLLKEFHGNVWCLRPTSWEISENEVAPCYEGENSYTASSAFLEAFKDNGSLIRAAMKDESIVDSQTQDYAHTAFGKFYSDFVLDNADINASPIVNQENRNCISELVNEAKLLKFIIPDEIIKNNQSIHPKRIQELYLFLSSLINIEDWLIPLPNRAGFKVKLQIIFMHLQRILAREENNSYIFDAWLATEWIHNQPLKIIIEKRLNWLKSQGNDPNPREIIYQLLEALDYRIRFKYVKYIRLYKDIISLVLKEKGEDELESRVIALDVYLECGASNPVALSLLSLGLSRTTALLLIDKVKFPDDASPELCMSILAKYDIAMLGLPKVCKQGILDLISY